MKGKRKISGSLRYELIAGLLAVILFSGGITYLSVLIGSKNSFDNLVRENDLETARTYASALAGVYSEEGNWDSVEDSAEQLSRIPVPRDDKHHDRDGIPLVLTDVKGHVVYNGLDPDGRDSNSLDSLKIEDGEAVVLEGETVGYVFFKSMIFSRYNPQETEFLSSFRGSLTLSVLSGFIVALILGSFFASRIIRPLSSLDRAVKAVAEGDRTARVNVSRRDEIGRFAGNFNLMTDKLRVTEEARQNLLADISHELRTPVSIIQANLEMIMEGVYTLDENRLESMYKETKILTGLITDLRSISDMDAGLVEHQPEVIPFAAMVEGSCHDMQPLFCDKEMVLDLQSMDQVTVLAEEEKLRQVLRNILGNALKYAGEGTTVHIASELLSPAEGKPERVRLRITDEGPGVPEEDLDRIFDRFYRVDSSRTRSTGGRGLGLSICRKIIELSGGEIGAEPGASGKGLSIWITLPVCSE